MRSWLLLAVVSLAACGQEDKLDTKNSGLEVNGAMAFAERPSNSELSADAQEARREHQVSKRPNASRTHRRVVERHEHYVSQLKEKKLKSKKIVREEVDHDNRVTKIYTSDGKVYSIETDHDGGQVVESTPEGDKVYNVPAINLN